MEAKAETVERQMKLLKEAMQQAREGEQAEFSRSCRISMTACRRSRLCSGSDRSGKADGHPLTGAR